MADPSSLQPPLGHLRWTSRPVTSAPVMVAAFEGWNDAGNAATTAVEYLTEQWHGEPFATIDPEIFYDFSSTRPTVRLDELDRREIVWPSNELAFAADVNGTSLEVVTLRGVEPQLRWRTFCDQIIGLAGELGCSMVVTVGALLAEVPHSRPVTVFGATADQTLADELGLQPSRYEGPTGIVGVLHTACSTAGIRSASLWAAVPTYLPNATSPKAALALVEKAASLLGTSISTTELEIAAASYERQVNEAVAADDETASYITDLERKFDETEDPFGSSESLAEEVERFLREQ